LKDDRKVNHRPQHLYEAEQAAHFKLQLLFIFDRYFEIDSLNKLQADELDDRLFRAVMGRFRNVRENMMEE